MMLEINSSRKGAANLALEQNRQTYSEVDCSMATINLFQSLRKHGDDSRFVPVVSNDFRPTNAPAGSPEKIRVLADRVQRGWPLWHPLDGCHDDEFASSILNARNNRPLLAATSAAMHAIVETSVERNVSVARKSGRNDPAHPRRKRTRHPLRGE